MKNGSTQTSFPTSNLSKKNGFLIVRQESRRSQFYEGIGFYSGINLSATGAAIPITVTAASKIAPTQPPVTKHT